MGKTSLERRTCRTNRAPRGGMGNNVMSEVTFPNKKAKKRAPLVIKLSDQARKALGRDA